MSASPPTSAGAVPSAGEAATGLPDPSGQEARGRLHGLFRHSLVYSAAPFLRQLISVGMTPLYTLWLGTAGIGVKETADLWLIGLQQLLGQNALGSMMRFYYDQRSEHDRARVVTSCTLVVTGLAWLVCLVSLGLSPWLVGPLLGSGSEIPRSELLGVLHLVLLLIPFQLSTMSGLYYLMTLKRSGAYAVIQTVKLLFEVGMNVWLIGYLDLGVRGFLTSMLCGEVLTSLCLTGWMLVRLGPRIDWRILRPILVYAAPLIPVGICQLALHQIDRRLIMAFAPSDVAQSMTGIYGFGYKIAYLVTAMMLGPFVQIFQPWIFSVKDEHERGHLVARVSTYAVLAIGAASMGVELFGRQAAQILAGDPRFHPAWRVIPFVSAGYVFWALYHVSQMPLFLAKRTGRLFVINFAAVVFNVGMNAALIPRMGFVGAGLTTLLTFALLAGMGMWISRSQASVDFEGWRLLVVLTTVLAAGAAAFGLDHAAEAGRLTLLPALLLKVAILALLLLFLWRSVLHHDERRDLRQWVSRSRSSAPPTS